MDQTTPSPWLTRQKSFKNLGGSKTLRICIIYGTRKETTQQEIVGSSLIGMQEKEKKIRKKEEDNKKKDEDNMEDKRF
jgi:hypothetical protein